MLFGDPEVLPSLRATQQESERHGERVSWARPRRDPAGLAAAARGQHPRSGFRDLGGSQGFAQGSSQKPGLRDRNARRRRCQRAEEEPPAAPPPAVLPPPCLGPASPARADAGGRLARSQRFLGQRPPPRPPGRVGLPGPCRPLSTRRKPPQRPAAARKPIPHCLKTGTSVAKAEQGLHSRRRREKRVHPPREASWLSTRGHSHAPASCPQAPAGLQRAGLVCGVRLLGPALGQGAGSPALGCVRCPVGGQPLGSLLCGPGEPLCLFLAVPGKRLPATGTGESCGVKLAPKGPLRPRAPPPPGPTSSSALPSPSAHFHCSGGRPGSKAVLILAVPG